MFIKKRENINAKVPPIAMIQGGKAAASKGKNEFIRNQKIRKTEIVNLLQLPKSEVLVGGTTDSTILELPPAEVEGDTSIFQQT